MAHKIKVKLGEAEFEAEGAEERVQAQYEQFLSALQNTAPKLRSPTPAHHDDQADTRLARIFELRQDGSIVFRVHPPETFDPSDQLALLLLGYRKLGGKDHVLSTQLSKSARQSGLGDVRIDQLAQPYIPRFILRGGQRKGTTYTLTTQGETKAQEIAIQMPV